MSLRYHLASIYLPEKNRVCVFLSKNKCLLDNVHVCVLSSLFTCAVIPVLALLCVCFACVHLCVCVCVCVCAFICICAPVHACPGAASLYCLLCKGLELKAF